MFFFNSFHSGCVALRGYVGNAEVVSCGARCCAPLSGYVGSAEVVSLSEVTAA